MKCVTLKSLNLIHLKLKKVQHRNLKEKEIKTNLH